MWTLESGDDGDWCDESEECNCGRADCYTIIGVRTVRQKSILSGVRWWVMRMRKEYSAALCCVNTVPHCNSNAGRWFMRHASYVTVRVWARTDLLGVRRRAQTQIYKNELDPWFTFQHPAQQTDALTSHSTQLPDPQRRFQMLPVKCKHTFQGCPFQAKPQGICIRTCEFVSCSYPKDSI